MQEKGVKLYIREAVSGDNDMLQSFQKAASYGEGGSVSSVNHPDYSWRTKVYERGKVFMACDEADNHPMGSASCAVKSANINDLSTLVGYSWNYYTSPDHRRKGVAIALIAKVEEFYRQQGASLAYVYIMDSNAPSIALFEKSGYSRHKALLARYKLIYRKSDSNDKNNVRTLVPNDLDEVSRLINATWEGHDLFTPYSATSFAASIERVPGFSYDDIYVLEKDGRIAACVGCWDRGKAVRTTVKSMGTKMRIASMVLDATRLFTPMPKVLKPGEVMTQYRLMPVGYKHLDDLKALLKTINNRALSKGIYAICGASENDAPIAHCLQSMFRNDVNLLLYAKSLDGSTRLSDNPVYVDVVDI
ncbi:MAG: GNAT family N-acetyltransferase [Armatimonadetes bacterium]|jgi:GNAT superfamily N-acetyltransferase|nr:GNAT family N-acetyltransferase [Armatimonadota bacterium]